MLTDNIPWHALRQTLWGTQLCFGLTFSKSHLTMNPEQRCPDIQDISVSAWTQLSFVAPTIAHFVFYFYRCHLGEQLESPFVLALLSLSNTTLGAQGLLGMEPIVQGRRRSLSPPGSHLSGITKSNSRTRFKGETPCCTHRDSHE